MLTENDVYFIQHQLEQGKSSFANVALAAHVSIALLRHLQALQHNVACRLHLLMCTRMFESMASVQRLISNACQRNSEKDNDLNVQLVIWKQTLKSALPSYGKLLRSHLNAIRCCVLIVQHL